jgi:hypothetical protein
MIRKLAPAFLLHAMRWLLRVLENQKEEIAMAFALEVNLALWIMIGCAAEKIVQFAGYLN